MAFRLTDNTLQSKVERHSRLSLIACLVSLSIFGLTVNVEARQYYRYLDENGRLVISHNIPAERVKFGYEVVTETGMLVKRVERQLSKDEYKAKQASEKALAECNAAVRRVDNLYQIRADIDAAESQSLRSIETSIANAKDNLTHVRSQRRELESQAAQKDIEGRSIPHELLANIERAQTQERTLEEEIKIRISEKSSQKIQYRYDRAVFNLENCDQGLPKKSVISNQQSDQADESSGDVSAQSQENSAASKSSFDEQITAR